MQRRNTQAQIIFRERLATGRYPGGELWLIDWRKAKLPYCSIYVIGPVDGWPSKIGVSTSPRKRIATLQTAHWKELRVWDCVFTESEDLARKVERKAHELLKDEGALLFGEWFDKRPAQLGEFIEFAANLVDVEVSRKAPWDQFAAAFREMIEAGM